MESTHKLGIVARYFTRPPLYLYIRRNEQARSGEEGRGRVHAHHFHSGPKQRNLSGTLLFWTGTYLARTQLRAVSPSLSRPWEPCSVLASHFLFALAVPARAGRSFSQRCTVEVSSHYVCYRKALRVSVRTSTITFVIYSETSCAGAAAGPSMSRHLRQRVAAPKKSVRIAGPSS